MREVLECGSHFVRRCLITKRQLMGACQLASLSLGAAQRERRPPFTVDQSQSRAGRSLISVFAVEPRFISNVNRFSFFIEARNIFKRLRFSLALPFIAKSSERDLGLLNKLNFDSLSSLAGRQLPVHPSRETRWLPT